MKCAGALALIAALVVFVVVPPSYAAGRHHGGFHHGGPHHHGFHHHGFHHGGLHHRGFHHRGFRTGGFIGFGLTYPYYPYYPLYGSRPLVIQQPPIYVQQAPTTAPLEPGYWYFCQSGGAYYPTAPSCPEAWVKVPPRTE